MPELADRQDELNPKSLISKARAYRMLAATRAYYLGAGLLRLQTWERKVSNEWDALDTLEDVLDRINGRVACVKALDIILDRRRILCGDPLPRGGGSKTAQRMIELEPQSIPADELIVPEPEKPEPGQSVD